MADVSALIRDVPDFPEPGIVYKDITPLLADPVGFAAAVDAMVEPWVDAGVDKVVGIEARGFMFATPVAQALGVGFVPVRKAGKLPCPTLAQDYGLEYGTDTLEIHTDSLAPAERALVIDDVLATGGSAAATAALITATGAELVGFGFLIELAGLSGRDRLDDARIETVMTVGGSD